MSNDKLAHDAETVLECFSDIDAGKLHHCVFSHANVVMVSKDHYAALQDAAHEAEKQAGPVAWGSGDGYWIRAEDKPGRPDAKRFTEAFYAAPPSESAPVEQAGPVAWLNYPCITDADGNFIKHGEPELGFRRLAYGYDADKAVPLYAAPPFESDKEDAELTDAEIGKNMK